MSAAELNQKKLELIAWINKISDASMIEFLDGLKSSKTNGDWWCELSVRQQQQIRQGTEDVESGNVISSDAFWNRLKNG